MTKWISVEDGLPVEGKDVWVVVSLRSVNVMGVEVGHLVGDRWTVFNWDNIFMKSGRSVRYWQPMVKPDPPDDDK